jgi:hypothetical protein
MSPGPAVAAAQHDLMSLLAQPWNYVKQAIGHLLWQVGMPV